MQGTNAHMLLGRAGGSGQDQQAAAVAAALPWQRNRFWPSPEPHKMLHRAASGSRPLGCASLEAQLLAPALSFLWDHQVQGTAVLPGMALLEIAAAACHVLRSSSGGSDQQAVRNGGSPLLLQDSSVPAPVVLSAAVAAMRLQADVQHMDGSLTVRSMHTQSTHLASRTSQCAEPTVRGKRPSLNPTAAALSKQLSALVISSMSQPFQTASLAVDPRRHADGFLCHPAVVDSCLHLGASLAQPSSNGSAPTMHVPVGIQVFAAGDGFLATAAAELHGACQLHSMPAEQGPALSSYRLQQAATDASADAAVTLGGLEARPIRLPTASKAQLFPSVAAAAETARGEQQPDVQTVPLLYQVQWEAFCPTGQPDGTATTQLQPACTLTVARNSSATNLQLQYGGGKAAQAAPLLSGLLAALQQATDGGLTGAEVSLATHRAMQAGHSISAPTIAAAGAAAWGMLRVAASEVPHARWAATDADRQAACSQAAPAVDVAGTLERNGTALRPMLRPSHAAAPAGNDVRMRLAGRVLVTGGLGGEQPECNVFA